MRRYLVVTFSVLFSILFVTAARADNEKMFFDDEMSIAKNFDIQQCSSHILLTNTEYNKLLNNDLSDINYAKNRIRDMETRSKSICNCVALRVNSKKLESEDEIDRRKIIVYTYDVIRSFSNPETTFNDAVIDPIQYSSLDRLSEVLDTKNHCGML